MFFRNSRTLSNLKQGNAGHSHPNVPNPQDGPDYLGNLDAAIHYMTTSLGQSSDFGVRKLKVGERSAAIFFVQTLCDHKAIEEALRAIHQHTFPKLRSKYVPEYLLDNVLPSSDTTSMSNLYDLKEAVTSGDFVLLIEGVANGISIAAKFIEHRTPEPPYIESSVRGIQISFVEDIDVNIGQLRNMMHTETLHVKKLKVGLRSRTEVAVVYLEDVANPIAVETVIERIEAVHVDMITQGAALEQRIMGHAWSPFPLSRVTQRIDSTVHEINQGKIAIIVNGDPSIMLVPVSILDFFQTAEDWSHSYFEATFIRWLRIVAFILALFLPALYIAFVDFNPELLPKTLGIQIAKSREGVPFPAVMEVFIMQIAIEILREATLRMPKQMGQTIGIVGGLVIGTASVEAGLVSNILIIVIAVSAISVFVMPSYEFATVVRLSTWAMAISATIFGLYGVILATILYLAELSALKSIGISYLSPFDGEHLKDIFTDGLIRLPLTLIDKRTRHLHPLDPIRKSKYQNPDPHPQLEKLTNDPNLRRGQKP